MLEVLPESKGNVLGIRATGKLTAEDYKEIFLPGWDTAASAGGKPRVLLCLDESFQGWELGALRDDADFNLKLKNECEKLALVCSPEWYEETVSFGKVLMRTRIKTFACGQLQEAWDWVKS